MSVCPSCGTPTVIAEHLQSVVIARAGFRPEPPVTYSNWRGKLRDLPLPPGDWPKPLEIYYHSEDWYHHGWFPASRNARQRIAATWHLGRLQQYPRLAVLSFCIRRAWGTRWFSRPWR